jgi:ubiquinone/menaquinone biosynthesis C-methylase UbiE
VLDVGCGTRAITRGVAEAVAPNGITLGVDVNADMIAEAHAMHAGVPCLQFRVADVHA